MENLHVLQGSVQSLERNNRAVGGPELLFGNTTGDLALQNQQINSDKMKSGMFHLRNFHIFLTPAFLTSQQWPVFVEYAFFAP